MNDRRTPQDRLAALGAHLAARRFEVDLTSTGLKVTNPDAAGCCDEARHAADTITCRSRPDDDNRWWYFTSWGEPIAPADQITDAAVYVLGYLAGRSATTQATQ